MKIEIDLEDVLTEHYGDGDAGRASMRAALEDRAASLILNQLTHDERHETRQRVQAIRNEMIREHLAAEVARAVEDPIRRTTPWGETQGEETTVRELVRQELEDYLRKPAQRDAYGRSSDRPANLKELIAEVTRDVMGKEMRDTIAATRKQVAAMIRDQIMAAAGAALAKDR